MCKKSIYLVSFVLVFGLVSTSMANLNDPDLVAYWSFDEGSGTTAYDLTGNGNDGVFVGDPQWVAGKYGGALEFNGDDYLNCGNGPSLQIRDEITIVFWFQVEAFQNDWEAFLAKSDSAYRASRSATTGNATHMGLSGTSVGNGNGYFDASVTVTDGQWHHWAGVYDGTEARVYIDGVLDTTSAGTGQISLSSSDLYIGENSGATGRLLHGILDDVAIYSRALSLEEIQTIMEGFVSPELALNPIPEEEAEDVYRDVVLSWKPGETAQTHDVYLGTVLDDVNDASRDNPLNVLLSQGQDANTYEPGRLELGRMHYWRVDEIGADGVTIHTGEIWSFTVEPFVYAIPGENITVIASSSEGNKEPENVINGSGLDESGLLHTNLGEENMWLSSRDGEQPTWIEFEFDKAYKLYEMWVWNSNESLESAIGLGIKDVTIEYSVDGSDYTILGTTHEFAQAPGTRNYAHNTTIDFGSIPVKYVRLTANTNWGGILDQYGLSEVRFLYKPVHARVPSPAAGATDVPLDVTLGFRPGREAAEHNVFFSEDEQAIIDGTVDVTIMTEAGYGPLDLDLGKTYYWRVDEVNNTEIPSAWQGEVWDFTTFEYLVIDDFEDYNDYEPDRIFDTWLDGYGVATNGSTVGYPEPVFADDEHFVETNIVHEGAQSMPYFYDNNAGNSEATLPLSSLRNWTEKGVGSLTLWYRGNPAGFMEDPAGTYTVDASGTDIWATADEFRYVYKQLSGDGEIIAKVESVEDTDPWAKAGVMIRESLNAGSRHAFCCITPGNGKSFQNRTTTNLDSYSSNTAGFEAPYWVRLVRQGDQFSAYHSADGVNWELQAESGETTNPINITMPTNVYIGMAVTSHNANEICTAVFSSVETMGTITPQVWTQQAIGADMPTSEAVRMYVVLDESAVIYNDNPDASQIDEWAEWNIDLQEFADQGIDLTNVTSLGIGFGDRDNPQPGGAGLVFFDDIRLYPQQTP
ncbi:MAG: discoidin domain-containing protein [Phycisphaerales bacterium]|jgi:hypothetical protein